MMLHIVNRSPFERNALDACLRMAAPGGAVLLIEDAVYAAAKDTSLAERVRRAQDTLSFYVLGPDLQARGIGKDQVLEGVQVLDYGGFVDLTVEHHPIQSWL